MITERCIELIKKWEGYSSEAYLCPAGVWTVGWGSTWDMNGKRIEKGKVVNEEEAEELLRYEIMRCETAVLLNTRRISPYQADALTSFAFNLGKSALKGSSLLRYHNEERYDLAANEFLKWKWHKVNGVKHISPGLLARREDERRLYIADLQS